MDALEGHRVGYEKAVQLVDWCQNRGVKALTIFGFSTENWNRTEKEVSYLMRLLETGLLEQLKKYVGEKAKERGVRIRVIGQDSFEELEWNDIFSFIIDRRDARHPYIFEDT